MESFNEKCDRILIYLKSRPPETVEVTNWKRFTDDTGISQHDPCLSFLASKERKYITCTGYTINIEPAGIKFIEEDSFHATQLHQQENRKKNWWESQNAKNVFDDYPKVNRKANYAIGISIAVIVLELIKLLVGKE